MNFIQIKIFKKNIGKKCFLNYINIDIIINFLYIFQVDFFDINYFDLMGYL